jgi:hypothetical protein
MLHRTSSTWFILFHLTEFTSELVLSKERLDSHFTSLTPENASLHVLDKKNNNIKHTSEITGELSLVWHKQTPNRLLSQSASSNWLSTHLTVS